MAGGYGSLDRPVRLDPFQEIVEVGWPSGEYYLDFTLGFALGFTPDLFFNPYDLPDASSAYADEFLTDATGVYIGLQNAETGPFPALNDDTYYIGEIGGIVLTGLGRTDFGSWEYVGTSTPVVGGHQGDVGIGNYPYAKSESGLAVTLEQMAHQNGATPVGFSSYDGVAAGFAFYAVPKGAADIAVATLVADFTNATITATQYFNGTTLQTIAPKTLIAERVVFNRFLINKAHQARIAFKPQP